MMNYTDKSPIDEWLKALKPYQAETLSGLILEYGEEGAISHWFLAKGPMNNSPFGGSLGNDAKPFLQIFKTEFKKFLCGHPDYEKHREDLRKEGPVVKSVLIYIISAAIAMNLGFAASLLAPPVAIMLYIVGQVGINAYCATDG